MLSNNVTKTIQLTFQYKQITVTFLFEEVLQIVTVTVSEAIICL